MSTQAAKRNRLTLALTGVLVFLAGVIGWMEFGNQPEDKPVNANANNIVITRVGHADIVLNRSGVNWLMIAPYQLKANAQRIDPLLSLGVAKFDGYDKTEVDLPATGLSDPQASITIGQRAFLLGAPYADDERRYTLIDDKVSFVPSWVWSLVHGGVTAFADLTVFTQLPDALYLVSENEVIQLDNIEQFGTLQADRIAAWPHQPTQPENGDGNASAALQASWMLSTSAEPTADTIVAMLLRFDDRTLINTQPGFAFVISNARYDALMNP